MIVSACHDGHGGYGLRVAASSVGMWFRPEWTEITVHLPDEDEPVTATISDSFWRSSPELRGRGIKTFLERNGLLPWEKSRPPHFQLESLGGGEFRLKWLERVERQPRLRLDG